MSDTSIQAEQETMMTDKLTEQLENTKVSGPMSQQNLPQDILITDLNEHCLRHIFKQFYLLSDFCSILKVCRKFNEVAKEVFRLTLKKKKEQFFEIIPAQHVLDRSVTLSEVRDFLENFGHSFTWIQHKNGAISMFFLN